MCLYQEGLPGSRRADGKGLRRNVCALRCVRRCYSVSCISQTDVLGRTLCAACDCAADFGELPYQWAKKRYQEEEQQYGEPVTLQTSFQEDALTVRVAQNEKTVTLSYEQVEKLKRLDHIYILKMRDGSILLLDREGFTKGDAAAFVSFIKEKCTQHMESQA